MEILKLENDIKVFGMRVQNFPLGIGETFDALTRMLPPGDERLFYGISECTQDGIVYVAAAAETFNGEAEKYSCEIFYIERGEYLSAPLLDWPSKTTSIKGIIADLLKNERADSNKPCVEVYKNLHEMLCLVKMKEPIKDTITQKEGMTSKS
jgi:hypothetical protein